MAREESSGGITLAVTVDTKGDLFTGATKAAVRKAIQSGLEELGEMGETAVLARLRVVLKHPTGYYESRITHHRVADGMVVTDQNVIYGPWLEGVGSRNAPVTSFKGYHTFRQVKEMLEKRAQQVIDRHMDRYVR